MIGMSERNRPNHLREIVGNEDVIHRLENLVAIKKSNPKERLPHLMFLGAAGVGKTTAGRALAIDIYGEDQYEQYFFETNASDERGIKTVQGKFKEWSQTYGERVILADESDNMTNDAQMAFRGVMADSVDTTFILTGNYAEKFIEPIRSRCAKFYFKPLTEAQILGRLTYICEKEGIQLRVNDESESQTIFEGITYLAKSAHGDLRDAINTLETIVGQGKQISVEEVSMLAKPHSSSDMLITALRGNYKRAHDMLEDLLVKDGVDSATIIDDLYEVIPTLNIDQCTEAVKIRLMMRLAETERALKHGNRGLVQWSAFLASAWLYPHLNPLPREEII
jgi:DNA polymerase III delta prime subunit